MKHVLALALAASMALPLVAADPLPKPLVTGLKNPESVCVAPNGKMYVSEIGDFDKDGDGTVVVIENGKAVPFVKGLDDPKGLAAYQKWLFVADKKRIWRIDETGKAEVYVPEKAFPVPPLFLNDITVDPESGTVYVSDSGNLKGKGGAVFAIPPKMAPPKGGKEVRTAPMAGTVKLLIDANKLPALKIPNGVALDGASFLLLVDFGSGELHRINVADGTSEKLAEGLGSADGLTWDYHGRLFISDYKGGKIYCIPRPGVKPILIAEGFQNSADTCLDASGKNLLVPDMKAGTVTALPIKVPGWEVDDSPLPLQTAVAFPDLKWAGWKSETDSGKPNPLRPLLLTHAGDGSNRVFVGTEHGVIHVFPNDQKATETKIFLDIQDRVSYDDKQNEEGFLGLAFHPKFKDNGEFFVFYTTKKKPLTNIISRFKVSKDDPNKADAGSEEVLLTIEKPYWNHDGGTIAFGPDGYLYIAHGDGGLGGDPHSNGQKLSTLLGKILRIDVDHRDSGKNYAIPKDNPFVGQKDARPEIWAYGLRNVWRMAFDRKTGQLWAADVGQNLYEEIDLISKGGNYGWSLREALHPFGPTGVGPRKDLIDPIWEYHHDVGKSLTGGLVYRGTRLPDIEGSYIYGDYVTGKIWALKYDEAKKRVVANRPIKDQSIQILSFGEDEKGEAYFMTFTPTGRGIYWFVK
jgi:glucose/arabinose dehydrogenase/sugar lactone lactonase YvrE